eukprot:jgi/Mesvir1/19571/Mv09875-RA.1
MRPRWVSNLRRGLAISGGLHANNYTRPSSLDLAGATRASPSAISRVPQGTAHDSARRRSLLPGMLLLGAAALAGSQMMDYAGRDVAYADVSPTGFSLVPMWMRKRKFFHYEKRIRSHSMPDKVFTYFASVTLEDGCQYMLPMDFARALVDVHPPTHSTQCRSGFLAGESAEGKITVHEAGSSSWFSSILQGWGATASQSSPAGGGGKDKAALPVGAGAPGAAPTQVATGVVVPDGGRLIVDPRLASSDFFHPLQSAHVQARKYPHVVSSVDGSDLKNVALLSYSEFLFLAILLSIPLADMETVFGMFDLNGDNGIDRKEVIQMMAIMRGSKHMEVMVARTGFVMPSAAELETGDGILNYLFRDAEGKETHCLNLHTFTSFVSRLHNEVRRLEFAHYDVDNKGVICKMDFGLSLVARTDIHMVDALLARLEGLSESCTPGGTCEHAGITLDDFMAVGRMMSKVEDMRTALVALSRVRGDSSITREVFQRTVQVSCGVSLSDPVMDVIMHIFGKDVADASLDKPDGRERVVNVFEFLQVADNWVPKLSMASDVKLGQLMKCLVVCMQES